QLRRGRHHHHRRCGRLRHQLDELLRAAPLLLRRPLRLPMMRHAPHGPRTTDHGPRTAAPSTVHRLLSTVFLLAVGNLAIPAAAQVREAEFRVHDRGELWETAKDDGTLGAPAP